MTKKHFQIYLPKSSFPMRANLAAREPQLIEEYIARHQEIKQKISNRQSFIIVDGPPYANGKIHMGHALNKCLKDVACRYKIMMGFNVEITPGFDCHGLPIENHIKKNNGLLSDRTKLISVCRKFAYEQAQLQIQSFRQLNLFMDFNNSYFTIDPKYTQYELAVLSRLDKFLEKKLFPCHWCFECGSSLAEAEIEYQEKECTSLYFTFTTQDNYKIVLWTTTPWSIFSNKAVAINKNISYLSVRTKNQKYIIAEQAYKSIINDPDHVLHQLFFASEYQVIPVTSILAMKVFNTFNEQVSILHGDFVVDHTGTGIVHIAPSHGPEDFDLCNTHQIALEGAIDGKGFYIKGPLQGHNIQDPGIDQKIFDVLGEQFIAYTPYLHSTTYCWRHKCPTIHYATEQLFLNIDKQLLSQFLDDTDWQNKNSLLSNLFGRKRWCISRQRQWGLPIPDDINSNSIKQFQDTIDKEGIEGCKSKHILDVWFDSGCVIPFLTRNKKKKYVDLAIEGIDQFRGWFQSSFIISVYENRTSPFKKIISHNFVVDANLKKMSKSLGNVIDPIEIIQVYGSDILRLLLIQSNYLKSIVVSDKIISDIVVKYRKIRNTIRHLLGDFSQVSDINYNKLLPLDQWILSITNKTHKTIIQHYEQYNFSGVITVIYDFCCKYLSSLYLVLTKDRFYMCHRNSPEYLSLRFTYNKIINILTHWIAPILPFTSEEVYRSINCKDILLSSLMDHDLPVRVNDNDWEKLFKIKSQVQTILEKEKIREGFTLSLSLTEDYLRALQNSLVSLEDFFLAQKIEYTLAANNKNSIISTPIKAYKCERCWNYSCVVKEGLCAKCYSDPEGLQRSTL